MQTNADMKAFRNRQLHVEASQVLTSDGLGAACIFKYI